MREFVACMLGNISSPLSSESQRRRTLGTGLPCKPNALPSFAFVRTLSLPSHSFTHSLIIRWTLTSTCGTFVTFTTCTLPRAATTRRPLLPPPRRRTQRRPQLLLLHLRTRWSSTFEEREELRTDLWCLSGLPLCRPYGEDGRTTPGRDIRATGECLGRSLRAPKRPLGAAAMDFCCSVLAG